MDNRDTRIDPTLPGNPAKSIIQLWFRASVGERTTDNNSKKGETFVSTDKPVKDDTSSTTNHHGTEQRRPALGEERSYMVVADSEHETSDGTDNDESRQNEGDRRINDTY